MLKADSPLFVRPSLSPPFLRFMFTMARHCNEGDFRHALKVHLDMASTCNAVLDEWADDGLSFEMHRRGVLLVFEDRESSRAPRAAQRRVRPVRDGARTARCRRPARPRAVPVGACAPRHVLPRRPAGRAGLAHRCVGQAAEGAWSAGPRAHQRDRLRAVRRPRHGRGDRRRADRVRPGRPRHWSVDRRAGCEAGYGTADRAGKGLQRRLLPVARLTHHSVDVRERARCGHAVERATPAGRDDGVRGARHRHQRAQGRGRETRRRARASRTGM